MKINENTFLFNLLDDPMERANLRDRHRDIYERMILEWNDWDMTMLPEIRESFTNHFTAAELADHIGAKSASGEPDVGRVWPNGKPITGPSGPQSPFEKAD